MKTLKALLISGALCAGSFHSLLANPALLSDGFETNNLGVLDANFSPGQNAGPNGGPGNPWWGPNPPDLNVVNAEMQTIPGVITNNVVPHGGTNMIRGLGSGFQDNDRIVYNLAYRINNSNALSGNVALDWWFYDPVGTNSVANQYQDSVFLAYYPSLPTNSDYSNINPDPGTATGLLALGAATVQSTGYKATNYQAKVLGAGTGYSADGWFNLGTTLRSVGWHHGRISLSPAATNGSATATFYLDNMSTGVLTNSTVSTNGFNALEADAEFGNLTGYFDDFAISVATPPTLNITATSTNAVITWTAVGWTLQSATVLTNGGFADVVGATSPYTNVFNGTQQFFRLRF